MDPSPPTSTSASAAQAKQVLRGQFRKARREHVAQLPDSIRALLFLRPPAPIARTIPAGSTVGLYYPHPFEAPTLSYARWLHENGYKIALPHFDDREAAMAFRLWADPYDEDLLGPAPFGMLQPGGDAPVAEPTTLFLPLLAFTADGVRLGQGGGHYDRWLAEHPGTRTIGLAWDCQLAEDLPNEPHDRPLDAVITPTRLYEGHR